MSTLPLIVDDLSFRYRDRTTAEAQRWSATAVAALDGLSLATEPRAALLALAAAAVRRDR